jgi:tetratricopeptide (TPR) repeat protein
MADLLDGAQSLLAPPQGTAAPSRPAIEVYDGQYAQLRANGTPDDTRGIAARYVSLAYFFACAHRDKEAAEFVGKAALNAKRLTDPAALADALYYVALMQLRLGDEAGYRATCKALVDLPDFSAGVVAKARPIWTSCLASHALEDLSLLATRAEEYAANVSPKQRHFGPHILGAALYRAGQYKQAAQRLEASIAAFPSDSAANTDSTTYHRLFLAMTKWRLGQKDEARQLLTETIPAVEKELQSPSTVWHRRATLEILRGEAASLIEDKQTDEAVQNKSHNDGDPKQP